MRRNSGVTDSRPHGHRCRTRPDGGPVRRFNATSGATTARGQSTRGEGAGLLVRARSGPGGEVRIWTTPIRRTAADVRRAAGARAARRFRAGAMLVFSAEQAQPRRLEFQVPHSENHDFIYLTGLEGLDSLDSALLLLPTPDKQWAVLYTSADVRDDQDASPGIEERAPVRAARRGSVGRAHRLPRLAHHSGAAVAAARPRSPRPGAEHDKVLYLNYPRFLRLGHARAAAPRGLRSLAAVLAGARSCATRPIFSIRSACSTTATAWPACVGPCRSPVRASSRACAP